MVGLLVELGEKWRKRERDHLTSGRGFNDSPFTMPAKINLLNLISIAREEDKEEEEEEAEVCFNAFVEWFG